MAKRLNSIVNFGHILPWLGHRKVQEVSFLVSYIFFLVADSHWEGPWSIGPIGLLCAMRDRP